MASFRCFWSKGSSEWYSSRTRPQPPGLQSQVRGQRDGEVPTASGEPGHRGGGSPPARGWWRDPCARASTLGPRARRPPKGSLEPRAPAPPSTLPTSPTGKLTSVQGGFPPPPPPPTPLQGRCRAARNGRGPAPTAAADHSREPHRGWAARRAPHAPSRSPSSPQDRGSETVRARPRSHSDGAGARPGAAPDPPRQLRGQDPPRRRDPRPAPLASPYLTLRPSSRPASLASPRAPLASPPLTSPRAAARASTA